MEIIFLGTGSMVPTKTRNQSGIIIRFGKETILVDCGEGTQRQMKIAGIPLSKITKILITHLHGDHFFGIPGVLETIGATLPDKEVEIYGPENTKNTINQLKKVYDIKTKTEITDIKSDVVFENSEFRINTLKLDHSVPSYGYAIELINKIKIKKEKIEKEKITGRILKTLSEGKDILWKGKKIKAEEYTEVDDKIKKLTVIMDTKLCSNAIKLAENSTLLIAEATYEDKLKHKAEEYKHLTAGDAAEIANKSGSEQLVLTHFSQRYKTTGQIESDARKKFDNVTCAKDFTRIEI